MPDHTGASTVTIEELKERAREIYPEFARTSATRKRLSMIRLLGPKAFASSQRALVKKKAKEKDGKTIKSTLRRLTTATGRVAGR